MLGAQNRNTKPLLLAVALIALAAPTAHSQTAPPVASAPQAADQPTKPLEFDVVSIRQSKSGSNNVTSRSTSDGYFIENNPLIDIISNTYGIQVDRISGGPGWIESDPFDIQAKVAGSDLAAYRKLSKQQRGQMLQAVLADRFKLAAHTENKELPIYELVVAKNGPKLKESKPNTIPKSSTTGISMNSGARDIDAKAMSLSDLAQSLSYQLKITVVDKTGLAGKYDFELHWLQDQSVNVTAQTGEGDTAPSSPSIFTALQEQLGLKLNSTKGPVETLVIDHVERPSEN